MADVSHNPFRTPAASPNSTGNPQYAPPSNSPPSQQQYSPPSAPHPADPAGLTEEAPPAYTTRPDVYQGESTVEFGPSRPFQPAPRPPQNSPQTQASASPAPSLWQQLTGQMSGMSIQSAPPPSSSGWSTAYPGRQQQSPPQMHVQPPPQPQRPPPTTHLSEFARDFYATTNVPPSGFSDVSGARGAGASAPGYPPPPSAPPPGAGVPDDGRPTTMPVPGHPLLHEGKLLVYPPHHECYKCNNTGYKHGDPAHPCTKCWSRYARPYAGAVASSFPPPSSSSPSAPAASSSAFAAPNTGSTTFQRPLPRLYASSRAPSPGAHSSRSAYPPSPSGLYPERDLVFDGGRRHGRSRSAGSLRRGEGLLGSIRREVEDALHGGPGSVYRNNNAPGGYPVIGGRGGGGYPPPGVVYAPGDVRMGGTPCWRCGGRGTLSFLVFETVPCGVCRGVGRVFG
ncbi:hypothetical protein B0H16DRAFT_1665496 [Mycena metata]|uniref:Uncharacterized protein n=1 Tax=Mycena metata TaxID=1033252 RepID=A0AAD7MS86_9AGAR|nr:hypothetical protein B0H16DRAFT_1665496 [Mycena metata]